MLFVANIGCLFTVCCFACYCYRYANLTDLDFLSTPGFIAGVTNPMFKSKREWWDVLCDISTGEVLLSAPAEKDEYEATDRNFVLEVSR